VPEEVTPGAAFAQALASKDYARLRELLDPEIDFRGLTPSRSWEATDSRTLIEGILQRWFDESDEIERLENMQTDSFADRERVGYRFSVHNPDGRFLVEQQAYLSSRSGRIDWLRVLCSGFRPVE
jgi:hypothetical protein